MCRVNVGILALCLSTICLTNNYAKVEALSINRRVDNTMADQSTGIFFKRDRKGHGYHKGRWGNGDHKGRWGNGGHKERWGNVDHKGRGGHGGHKGRGGHGNHKGRGGHGGHGDHKRREGDKPQKETSASAY
ncbi:hypothetical protein BB561_006485 [Smittium simulii]|uniref:Uncharacterized protein n=1 Tax=Smittium simulii TaxID=133385 RepID=A0A2T9Y3T4_9FUNG|nr:hypothetical protein BB561_006485 [Smittium simulii]